MDGHRRARILIAYSTAVLSAYVLASVASTQTVLFSLVDFGITVDGALRLKTTTSDIVGLFPRYAPVIALSMLFAMPVAAGLTRLLPDARAGLFMLGGGAALVCAHVIMRAVFGVSPLPATRTLLGLLLQGAAGAVGGACCSILLPRARA